MPQVPRLHQRRRLDLVRMSSEQRIVGVALQPGIGIPGADQLGVLAGPDSRFDRPGRRPFFEVIIRGAGQLVLPDTVVVVNDGWDSLFVEKASATVHSTRP